MNNVGWQPIETAPRDAVRLLGYANDGWCCPFIYINICEIACVRGEWVGYCDEHKFTPTHWMPLPAPPV